MARPRPDAFLTAPLRLRDMRDCNILCFTETWLSPTVPDQAVTPSDSFFVLRADRTAESNKTKGGGVCFMVNRKWCDARSISTLSSGCSPHLEFLSIKCRPFYLPREFTSVIATVVYIPPQADTGMALSELHDVLSSLQNKDPGAALIVAGDFNKANLRQVMPNFYQHVPCPTRGDRILDHCYTPYKQGYKAVSHPAFGKSDHNAIFLIPQYKQSIRREDVTKREVKRWTAQSEATLQDALNDVDWDMFRACAVDINEFTEVAVCFVNMLAEEIIPTARVTTFPNQKPWMDRSIRTAVNARTASYNAGLATGDMSAYKAASYGVRRAVRDAKRRYRERVESRFHQGDTRSMWHGLRTITDYKARDTAPINADSAFTNELNRFYARFEVSQAANAIYRLATEDSDVISERPVTSIRYVMYVSCCTHGPLLVQFRIMSLTYVSYQIQGVQNY
ncbi:uncharacterized protein LOC112435595 [Maylandia zebra]|uniref:uncharacterized protein LOC112435595 n=1 Tax=Maylandia zebra TaxID=106582 RepID=UPI00403C16AC